MGIWLFAPGKLCALGPVLHFSPFLPQLAARGGRQGTRRLPGAPQTGPFSWWAGVGWVWLLVVETASLCRQGGRRREGPRANARSVFWLSSLESKKLSLRCKTCPCFQVQLASCKQRLGKASSSLERTASLSVDCNLGGEIQPVDAGAGCRAGCAVLCVRPVQRDIANRVFSQQCLGGGLCVMPPLPGGLQGCCCPSDPVSMAVLSACPRLCGGGYTHMGPRHACGVRLRVGSRVFLAPRCY